MHDSTRFGTQDMQAAILHHLTYTVGKDADHATTYDWRMALSHALRDRIVDVWFASTRRVYAAGAKRVYYLSMEFLIGRLLDDAIINLGLEMPRAALRSFGCDFGAVMPMNRTRRSAMAAWAGWPPVSSIRCPRSACRPMATASGTNTACSGSASSMAARSRSRRTGCRSPMLGIRASRDAPIR
jgi:hypothetical protein